MIGQFKRFLRFDSRDKLIAMSAVFLLPITNASIRILGFNRTKDLIRKLLNRIPLKPSSRSPFEIASFVYSAQRIALFGGNCLPRSIVIHRILNSLGYECEIHFGQKFIDDEMKGHAWVTHEGEALAKAEEDLSSYEAFDRPIPE